MTKHTVVGIFKEVTNSRVFQIVLYAFATLVVACFIFQAGVMVGFHKASFGHDWGENYVKNFGGKQAFGIVSTLPDSFPNAHGAIGTIIKSDGSTFIVEDNDGTEKSVVVDENTEIRKMRIKGTSSDLTENSTVVVIGNPNAKGQIQAKLIRLMPPMPQGNTFFFQKKVPVGDSTQ